MTLYQRVIEEARKARESKPDPLAKRARFACSRWRRLGYKVPR